MTAYMDTSDLGPSLLSARGMATISEAKTAELLGVPLMSEKAHPSLPGVTVGERIPEAVEVVGLVRKVLNETGDILVKQGFLSLGAFVEEVLNETTSQTSEERSSILVEKASESHSIGRLLICICS